jgi:hypothetical protein
LQYDGIRDFYLTDGGVMEAAWEKYRIDQANSKKLVF